jgi:hypothetical protein
LSVTGELVRKPACAGSAMSSSKSKLDRSQSGEARGEDCLRKGGWC